MKQMAGVSDMNPGKTSQGLQAFRERHARMVVTPQGTLISDPEWGIGVQTFIGKKISGDRDLKLIESFAKSQHLRDPETSDAAVTLVRVNDSTYAYRSRLTTKSGVVVDVDRQVSVTQ